MATKTGKGALKFSKMAKSVKVGKVIPADVTEKLAAKYAGKITNIARQTSGQGKLSEDSTHGDRWSPEEEEYLKYVCTNGKGYVLAAAMLKRDSTVGPWAHAKSMGMKMSKSKSELTPEEKKLCDAWRGNNVARKVNALKAGKVHPNIWTNGR